MLTSDGESGFRSAGLIYSNYSHLTHVAVPVSLPIVTLLLTLRHLMPPIIHTSPVAATEDPGFAPGVSSNYSHLLSWQDPRIELGTYSNAIRDSKPSNYSHLTHVAGSETTACKAVGKQTTV